MQKWNKKNFYKTMQNKAAEAKSSDKVCTRKEIEQLPAVLQKYCKYIGLENFPKYQVVNARFDKTDFIFNTKSEKVLKMDYDLWLFYDEIFRSAFCRSSICGIPFEGSDYVTDDGKGGMQGFLAKVLPLFNVCDAQGYKASLISWLAESAVVNPSVFLSPYVSYEEIDDSHLKATITYQGVSGSGIFTFLESGAISEFYSAERQVEEIDGQKLRLGWKCYCEQYEERNGIRMATKIKSTKLFPDGKELVYFASDNFTVTHL